MSKKSNNKKVTGLKEPISKRSSIESIQRKLNYAQ